MDQVSVTDLYQAAYFLCNGCSVESVQCVPVNNHVACTLTFSGENTRKLQDEFFASQAVVNLSLFRQAYSQVQSYVHHAKKSYAISRRHSGGEA